MRVGCRVELGGVGFGYGVSLDAEPMGWFVVGMNGRLHLHRDQHRHRSTLPHFTSHRTLRNGDVVKFFCQVFGYIFSFSFFEICFGLVFFVFCLAAFD